MSTCPHVPPERSTPITWTTNYRGSSYVLTDDGRLAPAAPRTPAAAVQARGYSRAVPAPGRSTNSPQTGVHERNPMTVNNTASPPSSPVEELLAARYQQEATDLEYRHRPHIIRQIIADELAGLEQRRTDMQDSMSKEYDRG